MSDRAVIIRRMFASPKLAGEILAELTHGGPLPVHFGELLPHSGQFVRHSYVVVGDVAVRAYKAKGRWSYDDRELRRAGAGVCGCRPPGLDRGGLPQLR